MKEDYPADESPFQEWRRLDIERHIKLKKDLEELKDQQLVRDCKLNIHFYHICDTLIILFKFKS